MKILITVFLFLGLLFMPALSWANGASSSSGGVNIAPINVMPANIAPINVTPSNITGPNITRPNITPATSANFPQVEHFQAGLIAQQQEQQKAWEENMKAQQRQRDEARAAELAAAAAAQIAPAAGKPAPAPYEPSPFLVGLVKLVNAFAPAHKDQTANAP